MLYAAGDYGASGLVMSSARGAWPWLSRRPFASVGRCSIHFAAVVRVVDGGSGLVGSLMPVACRGVWAGSSTAAGLRRMA